MFKKKATTGSPKDHDLSEAKKKILQHAADYQATSPWTDEEIQESNHFQTMVTQLDDILEGKITLKQKKVLSILAIHESDLSEESKSTLYGQLGEIYSDKQDK